MWKQLVHLCLNLNSLQFGPKQSLLLPEEGIFQLVSIFSDQLDQVQQGPAQEDANRAAQGSHNGDKVLEGAFLFLMDFFG